MCPRNSSTLHVNKTRQSSAAASPSPLLDVLQQWGHQGMSCLEAAKTRAAIAVDASVAASIKCTHLEAWRALRQTQGPAGGLPPQPRRCAAHLRHTSPSAEIAVAKRMELRSRVHRADTRNGISRGLASCRPTIRSPYLFVGSAEALKEAAHGSALGKQALAAPVVQDQVAHCHGAVPSSLCPVPTR